MSKRIKESFISNLIQTSRLSESISRVVKLKRTGPGQFIGLCPFHGEKTPSFHVNDNKGLYHCFGCKKSGNIITWYKEYHNLDYLHAIEEIAQVEGRSVEYEEVYVDPRKKAEEEHNKRLRDIDLKVLQGVTFLYRSQLRHYPEAMAYLNQRGISPEMIDLYQIGYAPGNNFLKFGVDQNRFGGIDGVPNIKESLLRLMLIKTTMPEPNKPAREYDAFRERIMFPVFNNLKQVVAFGGRRIDGKKEAKYINSDNSLVYNKSAEIFGLAQVEEMHRRFGKKLERIILVEGYLDVISVMQAGIPEAVSASGTAISTEQMRTLLRKSHNLVLCMDGDEAGQSGIYKAIVAALPILRNEYRLSAVQLPNNDDPDSFIKRYEAQGEDGARAFIRYIANAHSALKFLTDFEYERVFKDVPANQVDMAMVEFIEAMQEHYALIPDEASLYKKNLLQNISQKTHQPIPDLDYMFTKAQDVIRERLAREKELERQRDQARRYHGHQDSGYGYSGNNRGGYGSRGGSLGGSLGGNRGGNLGGSGGYNQRNGSNYNGYNNHNSNPNNSNNNYNQGRGVNPQGRSLSTQNYQPHPNYQDQQAGGHQGQIGQQPANQVSNYGSSSQMQSMPQDGYRSSPASNSLTSNSPASNVASGVVENNRSLQKVNHGMAVNSGMGNAGNVGNTGDTGNNSRYVNTGHPSSGYPSSGYNSGYTNGQSRYEQQYGRNSGSRRYNNNKGNSNWQNNPARNSNFIKSLNQDVFGNEKGYVRGNYQRREQVRNTPLQQRKIPKHSIVGAQPGQQYAPPQNSHATNFANQGYSEQGYQGQGYQGQGYQAQGYQNQEFHQAEVPMHQQLNQYLPESEYPQALHQHNHNLEGYNKEHKGEEHSQVRSSGEYKSISPAEFIQSGLGQEGQSGATQSLAMQSGDIQATVANEQASPNSNSVNSPQPVVNDAKPLTDADVVAASGEAFVDFFALATQGTIASITSSSSSNLSNVSNMDVGVNSANSTATVNTPNSDNSSSSANSPSTLNSTSRKSNESAPSAGYPFQGEEVKVVNFNSEIASNSTTWTPKVNPVEAALNEANANLGNAQDNTSSSSGAETGWEASFYSGGGQASDSDPEGFWDSLAMQVGDQDLDSVISGVSRSLENREFTDSDYSDATESALRLMAASTPLAPLAAEPGLPIDNQVEFYFNDLLINLEELYFNDRIANIDYQALELNISAYYKSIRYLEKFAINYLAYFYQYPYELRDEIAKQQVTTLAHYGVRIFNAYEEFDKELWDIYQRNFSQFFNEYDKYLAKIKQDQEIAEIGAGVGRAGAGKAGVGKGGEAGAGRSRRDAHASHQSAPAKAVWEEQNPGTFSPQRVQEMEQRIASLTEQVRSFIKTKYEALFSKYGNWERISEANFSLQEARADFSHFKDAKYRLMESCLEIFDCFLIRYRKVLNNANVEATLVSALKQLTIPNRRNIEDKLRIKIDSIPFVAKELMMQRSFDARNRILVEIYNRFDFKKYAYIPNPLKPLNPKPLPLIPIPNAWDNDAPLELGAGQYSFLSGKEITPEQVASWEQLRERVDTWLLEQLIDVPYILNTSAKERLQELKAQELSRLDRNRPVKDRIRTKREQQLAENPPQFVNRAWQYLDRERSDTNSKPEIREKATIGKANTLAPNSHTPISGSSSSLSSNSSTNNTSSNWESQSGANSSSHLAGTTSVSGVAPREAPKERKSAPRLADLKRQQQEQQQRNPQPTTNPSLSGTAMVAGMQADNSVVSDLSVQHQLSPDNANAPGEFQDFFAGVLIPQPEQVPTGYVLEDPEHQPIPVVSESATNLPLPQSPEHRLQEFMGEELVAEKNKNQQQAASDDDDLPF